MKGLKLVFCFFCGVLLLAVSFSTVFAKDKVIELKYAGAFGSNHPFSLADQAYFKKIENETGNRVKIVPYWGSTLIKQTEATQQLAKGVCDMAFVSPGIERSGFEVSRNMMVFFYGVKDPELALRVYRQVYNKFPEISSEYSHLKVLQNSPLMFYSLVSKKPVKTATDLKGLRVKSPAAFAKAFKDLGVEGVLMPMSEAYISLEKGLLDGVFTPLETLKSFRFAEVAKYCLVDTGATSAPFPKRAMNLKVWNSLPPDIQKVFDANIDWWASEEYRQFHIVEEEAMKFGKQEKVEFNALSDEELKILVDRIKAEAERAAVELDKKGLRGTEILKEIRHLVEQSK